MGDSLSHLDDLLLLAIPVGNCFPLISWPNLQITVIVNLV